MKKALAAVLAFLVSLAPAILHAERNTCNADYTNPSLLCMGLTNLYRLNEGSHSRRYDTFGYLDFERPDGVDVSAGTPQLFGRNTVSLDSTHYLRIPNSPSLGNGTWTVAVWFYQTSGTAADQALISKDSSTTHGTKLYLYWDGAGYQVAMTVYESETLLSYGVGSGTYVSLNAWHLAVFTFSPSLTAYSKIGVSQDGAAFAYQTVNHPIMTNLRDLRIGQHTDGSAPFIGHMGGLLFASRAWDATEVALYWNGGVGRDFPF